MFKGNNNSRSSLLRERSKSENTPPVINHPHNYLGIGKISKSTQTTLDLGSPSLWSPKFVRANRKIDVSPNFDQKSSPKRNMKRNRIITNPRMVHRALQIQ